MFKTKIRGFTFGLIMSYAMAIGMEIYNMALKYGFQAQPGGLSGLSYAAVGEALTETLYMGLLVLLRMNRDWKDNLRIIGLLLAVGIVCGIALDGLSIAL